MKERMVTERQAEGKKVLVGTFFPPSQVSEKTINTAITQDYSFNLFVEDTLH